MLNAPVFLRGPDWLTRISQCAIFAHTRAASHTDMNVYNAYLIDLDGHIVMRIDLACADDEAAKERAKHLAVGRHAQDRRIQAVALSGSAQARAGKNSSTG